MNEWNAKCIAVIAAMSRMCDQKPAPPEDQTPVYNAYDQVLDLCCNRVQKGWDPVLEEAEICAEAAH